MADRYGFFKNSSSNERSMRDVDFDEEDIWVVGRERKDTSPKFRNSKESSVSTQKRLPTASKMIPRANISNHEAKVYRQSAPINIHDWSKIYRKNSKIGFDGHGCYKAGLGTDDDGDATVKDDEVDDDNIPPHEWIAKKLARNQISSFSVREGAGRTLKGRDLCKVRNVVLTRTGFLE